MGSGPSESVPPPPQALSAAATAKPSVVSQGIAPLLLVVIVFITVFSSGRMLCGIIFHTSGPTSTDRQCARAARPDPKPNTKPIRHASGQQSDSAQAAAVSLRLMKSAATLTLEVCLKVLRPLVRLLVKRGVAYPAFAQALKAEFLAAAQRELKDRGMPQTDSAVSLLSGVHRRDVRNLTRLAETKPEDEGSTRPLSMAAEVVALWLNSAPFVDDGGRPRVLPRSGSEDSFDALVTRVSSDIRPRAVLDELLRLGGVAEEADGVRLLAEEFTPHQGMEEMAWMYASNMSDALSASSANLLGEGKFLEQSIFVDELTPASATKLHQVSRQAWRQAFKLVMQEAQDRFNDDAKHAKSDERSQRARFGVYFYAEPMDKGKKQ
ncbi:DUF6502 family protein [Paucibacter soli]|uniref:DUF6502 family protein n=1 Tax=Paucibacter soli TaxID=3133433 RepID=UPI0030A72750